jgi:hypothetical protein
VLLVSFSLLLVGTSFICCRISGTLAGLSFPQNCWRRSSIRRWPDCGFSVVDVGNFQQITLFLYDVPDVCGWCGGSTAGGIKVNTFGILLITSGTY